MRSIKIGDPAQVPNGAVVFIGSAIGYILLYKYLALEPRKSWMTQDILELTNSRKK